MYTRMHFAFPIVYLIDIYIWIYLRFSKWGRRTYTLGICVGLGIIFVHITYLLCRRLISLFRTYTKCFINWMKNKWNKRVAIELNLFCRIFQFFGIKVCICAQNKNGNFLHFFFWVVRNNSGRPLDIYMQKLTYIYIYTSVTIYILHTH